MAFKHLLGIGALLAVAAVASHTVAPPGPGAVAAAVNPAAVTKPVEDFDRATVERLVRHELKDPASITFDSMWPRNGIYFNDPYGPKMPIDTVCGRVVAKGRTMDFYAMLELKNAHVDKNGSALFRKSLPILCGLSVPAGDQPGVSLSRLPLVRENAGRSPSVRLPLS